LVFQGWDSFYVLIGGAASALIGLMFVMATLTGGRDPSTGARSSRVYLNPVVIHFSAVLLVSPMALVPAIDCT